MMKKQNEIMRYEDYQNYMYNKEEQAGDNRAIAAEASKVEIKERRERK